MAATSVTRENKKSARDGGISNASKSENHMVLSTTYALNNSDTKRIQVGLRRLNESGSFVPSIKITGNTSAGIYFDRACWQKLQENMESASGYLRGIIKDTPNPVIINDVAMKFITAYGARAIMLYLRQEENKSAVNDSDDATPPAPKKQKIYGPCIVMQQTSFVGLENIVKCVNTRFSQLESITIHVNDCARFLVTEIELNLSRGSASEDSVKQTLATKYENIEQNVRRQIRDLQFLDTRFEIVFHELISLYFGDIVKSIIISAAT